MRKGVQRKGEAAIRHVRRKEKVFNLADYAECPAPVKPLCGECFRALETEDELEHGFCLRHIAHSKRWPGVWDCPKYNDKVNAPACDFRRRYVPDAKYGGTACEKCENNPENSPMMGIIPWGLLTGIVWGVILLACAVFWTTVVYYLVRWLR